MYVKVNGVKVAYPGAATDIVETVWRPFSIDLATLGIDLSNITQLTIGFERTGPSGGTGIVFVDDISLYRPISGVEAY